MAVGGGSRAHEFVLGGGEEVVLALGDVRPGLVPGYMSRTVYVWWSRVIAKLRLRRNVEK